MKLHSINDIPVDNKRVFLRADLNVPLSKGVITNDFRLQAIIPTIDYLLERNATIVLATHIGRPDAHAKTHYFDEKLSTKLLLEWFTQRGYTIQHERDLYEAQRISKTVKRSIILLENLRFFNGETEHNIPFSQLLAATADLYVNDAFGLIHRNDTSVTLLPQQFAPQLRAIGLLMQKELQTLEQFVSTITQPYIIVLGGKKGRSKLPLLKKILTLPHNKRPEKIIAGGRIEQELLKEHQGFLKKAVQAEISILLPTDYLVKLPNGTHKRCHYTMMPPKGKIVDIGPKSITLFCKEIAQAQTIFSNGTMGMYEDRSALQGTKDILQAIAESNATTLISGGDTLAALHHVGLTDQINKRSTGGGAALAFVCTSNPYEELPALKALSLSLNSPL